MPKPGLAPRRAALALVQAVTVERRTLAEALPGVVEPLRPEERARAQRLATETLRWADRADRMLGPHLRKRPDPRVLDVLRLGTWEICADGAAAHGVVDALVTLMTERRETRHAAGLVNAVLRRVAEAGPAAWAGHPPPRLPKWLRRPLVAAWGAPVVAAMEAAHAAGAPLDLTPRDGDAEALARSLGGMALPTGSVRLGAASQVSALPGYAEGAWWVQDAASALPVRVLDPLPGERVLDLCAAPGGKTLQMAAAGAEVTALDLSAGRMARAAENLARIGLRAELIVADALLWPSSRGEEAMSGQLPKVAPEVGGRRPSAGASGTAEAGGESAADPAPDASASHGESGPERESLAAREDGEPYSGAERGPAGAGGTPAGGGFDAVLLDAPCSATGTIRRHPDLPHARDGGGLQALLELQAQLIDRALTHLRPGGRLVFCTCSLLPEEGEEQVRAALSRHPGLRVEPVLPPGVPPEWRDALGGLRTRPDFWPEAGGLDGFYIARLRLS